MTQTEINVEEVFKNFRELIGNQAQEIAILKTAVTHLEEKLAEKQKPEQPVTLKNTTPTD